MGSGWKQSFESTGLNYSLIKTSVRNLSLVPFIQAIFRHQRAALAAKEEVIIGASILLQKFLWLFNKLQFPDHRCKFSTKIGVKLNE